MPRRWSTQTRAWAYRFLALRDGELCQACSRRPPEYPLDIDHLDGDPTNSQPSNLRLLCHSCNVALANQSRSKRDQTRPHETPQARLHEIKPAEPGIPSVPPEREREIADRNRAVGTAVGREAVDYQAGSPEMRANDLYEVPYRTWLLQELRTRDFLTVQEAINAGAEIVGCASITAARYLAKLTSAAGPLQEQRDMLRTRVVTWREQP